MDAVDNIYQELHDVFKSNYKLSFKYLTIRQQLEKLSLVFGKKPYKSFKNFDDFYLDYQRKKGKTNSFPSLGTRVYYLGLLYGKQTDLIENIFILIKISNAYIHPYYSPTKELLDQIKNPNKTFYYNLRTLTFFTKKISAKKIPQDFFNHIKEPKDKYKKIDTTDKIDNIFEEYYNKHLKDILDSSEENISTDIVNMIEEIEDNPFDVFFMKNIKKFLD